MTTNLSMRSSFALVAALSLVASGAEAASPETTTTSTRTARPSVPEPSVPEPSGSSADARAQARDPAWRLLGDVAVALAKGDHAAAEATLRTILATFPDHPAAEHAVDVLVALGRAAPGDTPRTGPSHAFDLGAQLRNESKTGLARAELVSAQTLHGLATGFELCVLADCDDLRVVIGTVMLSSGLGLGASWFLSKGGITAGNAAAINAGTEWGAWNALALNLALDTEKEETIAGSLILGQLAGTGAGLLAWHFTRPSAGDVSFSNSAGLWSGVLAGMLVNLSDSTGQRETFTAALVASDVGLVAGVLLTRYVPMSRGRALLLDLGGGVGLLFGLGTDILIRGEDADRQDVLAAGAVGTVAGLALTYWLTESWDLPDAPEVSVALLPEDGGGRLVFGGTW
ncbi:hypothetical protein L6R52_09390 [Myxococcota bacterium]|nr:hypothetical protein [Myxococcota bacterium]